MPRWDDDEVLMADIGEALAREAVPEHRREAARAAFAWRTVDEELLQLSYDSAEVSAAAIRGADDPRLLSFELAGLSLELEIAADSIWGQVIPGRACSVTVENAAGDQLTTTADESGIFHLGVLPGPLRLRIGTDAEARQTDWLLL
jgi:hypothetical protein